MTNISSDVHIFLGDSIYGDDYDYELRESYPQLHAFLNLPVHVWWYYVFMYRKLSCRPTFQSLLGRTNYVISIWDDHDYGIDDEGKNNQMKHFSKRVFSNFWRLNEMRTSNENGVYGSYEFKDHKGSTSVVVILPDIKWDLTATRLVSDEQWKWLRNTIEKNSLSRIVLGLSTPFSSINNTHPSFASDLLGMLQDKQAVIVSGDPHTPSVTKISSSHVDITSSPLAQLAGFEPEYHKCLQSCGILNNQNNYGLLDFNNKKGFVVGKAGILLETDIFGN